MTTVSQELLFQGKRLKVILKKFVEVCTSEPRGKVHGAGGKHQKTPAQEGRGGAWVQSQPQSVGAPGSGRQWWWGDTYRWAGAGWVRGCGAAGTSPGRSSPRCCHWG